RFICVLAACLLVAACAARQPLSEAEQKALVLRYAEQDDFIKIFKNYDLFGGTTLTDDVALYIEVCCKTATDVEALLKDNWFKVTKQQLDETKRRSLLVNRKIDADFAIFGHRMAKPYAPAIYMHNNYVVAFFYKSGELAG